MSRKWWIAGGIAALGVAMLARQKSNETTDAIRKATGATEPPSSPKGGSFDARLTGYWPFQSGLSADERKMEGGIHDRKGHPLYTLEDYQAGRAPFVSVAGDYEIFPYGQKIAISAWPGVSFRVVDTGGHFHGAGKLYRLLGHEPLDICVASSSSKVPTTATVTIIPGDNYESGAVVASAKLKDQTLHGEL